MKKILALFAILLVFLIGIAITQNYLRNNGNLFAKPSTATINNHSFKLIIANTSKEKEIG